MPFPSAFLEKYGPWAVVTGASSGLGLEFARQLARSGLSLALVARRVDRLEKLSVSLRESHPVQVLLIPADLSTCAGRDAVVAATASLDVGLLVNNAGVELVGSFMRHPAERHAQLVELNCTAVTVLARVFARRMADRGRGGILFVSSIAANLLPWFATYSASKAFVRGLSLLIREELKPKGVDVLSLEPGAVASEMLERMTENVNFAKLGASTMPADQCVTEGLQSMWAGRASCTPGLMNRVLIAIWSLIPQRFQLSVKTAALGYAMDHELKKYS